MVSTTCIVMQQSAFDYLRTSIPMSIYPLQKVMDTNVIDLPADRCSLVGRGLFVIRIHFGFSSCSALHTFLRRLVIVSPFRSTLCVNNPEIKFNTHQRDYLYRYVKSLSKLCHVVLIY